MAHPGHYNLLQCLAYWTQCAIASYELACDKKSTAQSEKKRLKSIAEDMLADLRANTPPGDEDLAAKKDLQDATERLGRVEQRNIEEKAASVLKAKSTNTSPKAP